MRVNLKNIFKILIYYLIDLFIFPPKRISPNSILIIRLDAIGDYVLFRNFIEVLYRSNKYSNYKITLIGNKSWSNLSKELDSQFIEEYIWLDRKKFSRNLFYRYAKLKEISSSAYEVVINPTYSREFFLSEAIVKLVNAKIKIGSSGDISNLTVREKNISNQYYTKLIPTKEEVIFEFARNKEFFEKLIEDKINLSKPKIVFSDKKSKFNLPNKYVILFIGASLVHKKWDIEKFSSIAKHLKNTYKYKIVLCGGPGDLNESKLFRDFFNEDFIDLVGKTSLTELMYIIKNSDILISNDTVAPHLGMALDIKKIFVVYNGLNFGRFIPYPLSQSKNYNVIYPEEIENNFSDYNFLCNKYRFSTNLKINSISENRVIEKIDIEL